MNAPKTAIRNTLGRMVLGPFLWPRHFKPPVVVSENGQALARVAVVGVGHKGFNGGGKVEGSGFLAAFASACAERGVVLDFFSNVSSAATSATLGYDALVNIVHEEEDSLAPFERLETAFGTQVFNSAALARIVADKQLTNERLSEMGIPVPRLVEQNEQVADPIFSNARKGSHRQTFVIEDPRNLKPKRYNTEYIDTRFLFEGRYYYTTIRIMAVFGEMVTAWVRARDEAEGVPNVHSRDTPLDPRLLCFLHNSLIDERIEYLRELTHRLGETLGPGFFAHDLLTCARSGRIFVAETGFKFDDETYRQHLRPVVDEIQHLTRIHWADYPRNVAEKFVDCILSNRVI